MLGIKWEFEPHLAVSETSFQYIVQAPSPETPTDKRLTYFLKFLEYPDLVIANDAFNEFVKAPNKDITALASKLPREKLRRWLADPKTPINRLSGYGMMRWGSAERPTIARFLPKGRIVTDKDPERQFGIDGQIFGYLLLAGDEGLTTLEKARLAKSQDFGWRSLRA